MGEKELHVECVMTKAHRTVLVLLGAAAILACSAATAFAGDGYAGGGVAGESTGGGALPFTGADLTVYVVIGLVIAATGLALRRRSARVAAVRAHRERRTRGPGD
jgi:hypothetical protein